MKQRHLAYLFFLLLLVLSSSCRGKTSQKDDDFFQIIGFDNFNSDIVLSVVKDETQAEKLKIGFPVFLAITNRSRKTILFPKDMGIRIFAYAEDAQKWEEIRNLTNYTPDQEFKLPPKDKGHAGGTVVDLYPDIPDSTKGRIIRVAIIGKEINDNSPTDNIVGAYIDLTLEP
jgi:hypothetical protein